MQQDFTKRISIVVNKNLQSWQVLNTVGHISAYFGKLLHEQFDTGDYFITKDGINLPRNSQYPIIIFQADSKDLTKFIEKIKTADVKSMYFVKEMIETSDDEELSKMISGQDTNEITYLGAGIFGENSLNKKLTGNLKLWS